MAGFNRINMVSCVLPHTCKVFAEFHMPFSKNICVPENQPRYSVCCSDLCMIFRLW